MTPPRRAFGAPYRTVLALAGAWLVAAGSVANEPVVQHRLRVSLDPASHRVSVSDMVVVPDDVIASATGAVEFLLNQRFAIQRTDGGATPAAQAVEPGELILNGVAFDPGTEAPLSLYRIPLTGDDRSFTLTYTGMIDFGLSDPREEYTRGFRETAGIVDERGVYLDGDGHWYPMLGRGLVAYEIEIELPDGWHVISAGKGSSRNDSGLARWTSEGAVDEIYLTGGPLLRYQDAAGAVEALVYLRQADDALAAKYLAATAQYIEMYRGLLGPYPYAKFALVENFWETGYGMPSFTLLGPRVIRFPFILHSSYPHEILHNWWGNSVFVDYDAGNWCEGLTAYLADHLIQEQRGRGDEYRRNTLQKYRDYVKDGRDFPLAEFRERHSAATEAVGYGKSLMLFHMLRQRLGDDRFREGLVAFYRGFRGRRASFDDLRRSFESTLDEDLGHFFAQWLRRTGAPALELSPVDIVEVERGFRVRGALRQQQDGEPFVLDVPVHVVTTAGRSVETVRVTATANAFDLAADGRPLRLEVDPQYDVFRVLDPRETPPSIGQIFGEPKILAVLPAAEDAERVEGYRALMETWATDSHAIEVRTDAEVERLPDDRAVWLLGRSNRLAAVLFGGDAVAGLHATDDAVELAGERVARDGHSLVVIRRAPRNVERAVGWLVVDPPAAFAGMGRKLPHYGKYSYLAFEGDEPTNVVKGQWPVSDSPLSVDLRDAPSRADAPVAAPLPSRPALAELPPVFSRATLAEHVARLADPALEGRGLGTAGIERAATYIAERFAAAGLKPGGDDGYFQPFTVEHGPDGKPVRTANVIGYLEGSRSDWDGQAVLIGAHYDHLGRGWPDVHAGDEGQIHPGADDNASGVAVLLELARAYAEAGAPQRTLVFAAFSAEEAGRLGSRHFVEHPGRFPLSGLRSMVNLDTVGRLLDGPLTVLGTGTADEWPHIARGVSFVTGVDSRAVPAAAEASDQLTFIARGVPSVQIFTRAHGDYHRPGDTVDKVDTAGLVRVATFVKETVDYLAEREEPLTATIGETTGGDSAAARPSTGGRKVLFGTVPEFSYAGPGAQVASVVPGSPAERAGVRAGDVLLRLADTELEDLRHYSQILRTLEPGQTVTAVVRRDGQELSLTVTVEAR